MFVHGEKAQFEVQATPQLPGQFLQEVLSWTPPRRVSLAVVCSFVWKPQPRAAPPGTEAGHLNGFPSWFLEDVLSTPCDDGLHPPFTTQ